MDVVVKLDSQSKGHSVNGSGIPFTAKPTSNLKPPSRNGYGSEMQCGKAVKPINGAPTKASWLVALEELNTVYFNFKTQGYTPSSLQTHNILAYRLRAAMVFSRISSRRHQKHTSNPHHPPSPPPPHPI
ncbi:hypothetical protein MHYP_G00033700 [Metynnis hypsauchen]